MGGRGATVSSRSVGRQNLVDRTGSKHSLIRAVGGADILTWIDATTTSNKLGSNLTAATVDIVAGTEPVLGSNAPETVFSTVLNSTAYSFQSNESLKYNAGLFASNTGEVTIATRYCITGTPGNHILFELGNSNYHAIDGGMGLGAIEGGSPEVTRNWVAFGGQAPPATDGDTFILSDQVTQNTAQNIVATYAANVNPRGLFFKPEGDRVYVAGAFADATSPSSNKGKIVEFNLSSSWDIGTLLNPSAPTVYTSSFLNTKDTVNDNVPQGVFFRTK